MQPSRSKNGPSAHRLVGDAAIWSATVWMMYGAAEMALVALVPLMKKSLRTAMPGLSIQADLFPYIRMSGVALGAYPVMGALAGLLAGVLVAFTMPSTYASRKPDSRLVWSSFGMLTVAAAFAANALYADALFAVAATLVPTALAVLRLRLAFRGHSSGSAEFATHPWTAIALIVGTAFVAQPRSYIPGWWPAAIGLGYVGGVLLVSLALGRLHLGWPKTTGPRQSVLSHVAAALFVSCVGLAASLAAPSLASTAPARQLRPLPRRGDLPNVILITLDTVRADHVSAYGYVRDTSPWP